MTPEDEILEQMNNEDDSMDDVEKLMSEFNFDEELASLNASLNDAGLNEDSEEETPEEEAIPSEEVLDMDEIDAILSDISDVHPDRHVSAQDLEERIARYEEDPEAAEEALNPEGNETLGESV